MGLLDGFKDIFTNKKELESIKESIDKIQANYQQQYYYYPPIYFAPYTGEKTPGEMGAAKNYNLQYNYLRTRSWQAYIESEFAKIIIGKFTKWVIGSGLKVQPEPNEIVLNQEGIKFDTTDFIKQIEARFGIWAGSRYSDFANMIPLNTIAFEAFKHAIVGGDVLVVLRVIDNIVKVQIIDGSHVLSPYFNSEWFKVAQQGGNFIRHGIEMNENFEHIAYYVQNQLGQSTRISRIGENSGNLQAFMVYGSRYRIDNTRGLPLLSSVLETIKKLDRYKEATVGSAEERQKIAYSIEHSADSTGENPLMSKLQQSSLMGMGSAPESKSIDAYEAAATKVATTTNKQAINMPIGASLNLLESKNELYFKDFYTTNGQFLAAGVGIPFEVALSMYNSNYSASRASIKDWEHTMKTERASFADQFYQPIYNLWLELNILLGKLQAPGYIKSTIDHNIMALEAYQSSRWLGVNAPHIDPLKEVAAERLKLGDESTPLTTYDQSTESLGSGDFSTIMSKVKIEQKLTDGLKRQESETTIPATPSKNNDKKALLNAIKLLIESDNE